MYEDLKPLGTGEGPGKLSSLMRLMTAFCYHIEWAADGGEYGAKATDLGIEEPPTRSDACDSAYYLVNRANEVLCTMQDCMGITWIREVRVSLFSLATCFPVYMGKTDEEIGRMAASYSLRYMDAIYGAINKLMLLKMDIERIGGIDGWYDATAGEWMTTTEAVDMLLENLKGIWNQRSTCKTRLTERKFGIETNGKKGTEVRFKRDSIDLLILKLRLAESRKADEAERAARIALGYITPK